MRKVAVTGGLACGKTSICRLFEEFGAYVVSADAIVHDLILTEPSLQEAIIELLGPEVRREGVIDRKEVAKRVFADPKKLARLEQMIHPLVREKIQTAYDYAVKSKNFPLFVAEVPLLFESGSDIDFDMTLAITRSVAADQYAGPDYALRMQRQFSQREKAVRADIHIENEGTLGDLRQEAEQIFKRLTR